MKPVQRNAAVQAAAQPPGVIDAIADGLSVVLARPLLMTVPLLLDLYLWLGWKVTIERLTASIQRWLADTNVRDAPSTIDQLERIGRADVMKLLPSVFVPSLLTDADRAKIYTVGGKPVVSPPAWLDAAMLPVVILAAIAIAIVYTVPIADAAIDRSRSGAAVARAILRGALRLLGAAGLLVGAVMLVAAPLFVGSAVLLVLGADPAALLVAVLPLVVVAVLLACWFVPDAIVVSEVGPIRAVRNSLSVVRRYFWQTLGLIVASFVIAAGVGGIFTRIADTPPGLLVGAVGNAFVGTGLAIASMGFYASRVDQPAASNSTSSRTGRTGYRK